MYSKVIKEIDRRDEMQTLLYYPLNGDWTYKLNGSSTISLAGTKLLARILGVKFSDVVVKSTGMGYSGVAKARYKTTQTGAYSASQHCENAKVKATQLALRNAALNVIPQNYQELFANHRKVYFAHSMSLYGGKREMMVFKQVKEQAPSWVLINPSLAITKKESNEAMREGLAIVERCDALVFISQMNYLSRGVFEEVLHALEHKIPVSYLNDSGKFRRIEDKRYFEIVGSGDNWGRYAKIEF